MSVLSFDRLLPMVPMRQWVLSYPRSLRALLAFDARAARIALRAFVRTVFAWQRRVARKLGLSEVEVGAVSFAQRVGSALQLTPHFHVLIPDGVFTESDGQPAFHKLPRPKSDELEALLARIVRRTLSGLRRRGYLDDAAPVGPAAILLDTSHVAAAALTTSSRSGPLERAGKLCARIEGFSLEAGRHVHEHDREALRRLCCYGLRPPVALSRLSSTENGQVRLRFKRPFSDGSTHVDFSAVDFLRRLALCVPPPRFHQVSYWGLFAPHSSNRSALSGPPPEPPELLQPQLPAGATPSEIELHGTWLDDPLPGACPELAEGSPRPSHVSVCSTGRRFTVGVTESTQPDASSRVERLDREMRRAVAACESSAS